MTMAIENKKERGDLEINHSALLVSEEFKENEKEDEGSDKSLNCSLLLNEEDQTDPNDIINHVDVEVDEESKQQRQRNEEKWMKKIKWMCLTNWMKDEPLSIRYFSSHRRLCGKLFRLKVDYHVPSSSEEEEEDLEPRALLFENTETVKLAKFFILTLFLLICTHFIVRSMVCQKNIQRIIQYLEIYFFLFYHEPDIMMYFKLLFQIIIKEMGI